MSKQVVCGDDLIDAFLADVMSDREVVAFEQHLEQCTRCRDRLDERSARSAFWDHAQAFLSTDHGDRVTTTRGNISAVAGDDSSWEIDHASGEGHETLGMLDPTDDPAMMGRFAGYEVTGIIGRGGMGIVMKARDVSLDRLVAIKILDPSYSHYSASRRRFAREARSAAAVVHENVVGIFGVDQWKGIPFLVMPFVKGESLQHRIDRSAPLPLEEMLEISVQVARGLAAAHDQGVIHRDIKPSNILLLSSVSRVLITDFGLARTVDDASLTRSGVLAGTPQYMSPEQAKSLPVDHKTDLFSLGAVMYAMACGAPPFRSESPYGVLKKIVEQPHRSLLEKRPELPRWYVDLVDRLLSKSRDDRFDSADQLVGVLEQCLMHLRQPATTKQPVIKSGLKSLSVRSLGNVGAVVLLFFVLSVATQFAFRNRDSTSSTANSGERSSDEVAFGTDQSFTIDPELAWEYDDRELTGLEQELEALLNETDGDDLNLQPAVTGEIYDQE
ncbi:serine/threonine-protein kinase [Roseiconus lacunae]|uniref:Protein kinase n=1 Tax=Roseiconus lacunae TaxID=2605694 RepID=A0ABT7PS63_9BACT|nr:serine/threonine-protein kinase [Roseiconus lacunae]MDM4019114.1 protein kinase [Roseiconus lacunae]